MENGSKPYLQFYSNTETPESEDLPDLPKGSFNKITFTGKYCSGLKDDGVYHHKNSRVVLNTRKQFHTPLGMEGDTEIEITQQITITAKSFRTLSEAYSKVRSGEITPSENWGSIPLSDSPLNTLIEAIAMRGDMTDDSVKSH